MRNRKLASRSHCTADKRTVHGALNDWVSNKNNCHRKMGTLGYALCKAHVDSYVRGR